MRFLGCVGCNEDGPEISAALTHHVDFPTTHEICNHANRDIAILWATQNTGPFNHFRHYEYGDEVKCFMRFSFATIDDAFWFKTVFY